MLKKKKKKINDFFTLILDTKTIMYKQKTKYQENKYSKYKEIKIVTIS